MTAVHDVVSADAGVIAAMEEQLSAPTPVSDYERLIAAIMDEGDCDHHTARGLVEMVRKAVVVSRLPRPSTLFGSMNLLGFYVLNSIELSWLHRVLCKVMPDGQLNPVPGSAHDQLNRYFGLPRDVCLEHGRTGWDACRVAIRRVRI